MKSTLRLPILLLFLALPSRSATIPGVFRQIDADGGGWLTGFAIHLNGRVYARTDVGGLYRSDDRGENWTHLSGNFTTPAPSFVQGVAVSPLNSNLVYQCVGTSYSASDPGRGIWRSTDGGNTWSQTKPGLAFSGNDDVRWGGECVAFHPANPLAEIWAGSRQTGLWKTLNNGVSWSEVGSSTFTGVVLSTIHLHAAFPDQVWVGGHGGAWVSTNRGTSWTKVVNLERVWRITRKPDGTVYVAGGAATPAAATDTKLLRITAPDYGNPATYTQTDLWPGWLDAFQLARGYRPVEINPQLTLLSDGSIVAGCLYQGNAVTPNDGASWTLLPMALTGVQPSWQTNPGPAQVTGGRNAIAQDPLVPYRWYLAGGYGPLRSDSSGTAWKYILKGIGQTVAWQVRFHPTDPQRVYIPMADHGLAVLNDAGDSGATTGFIARHFPWPDDNVVFTHRPLVSGARILAPGGEQGGNTPRLYLSNNHGLTWTKRAFTGLPTGSGRMLVDALPSTDATNDFLVVTGGVTGSGAGGVYRTVNGGSAFTQSTGLPAGFDIGDLFWWNAKLQGDAGDPARRHLMLRGNGFYTSTNRGVSWSKPAVQPRGNYGRIAADAAVAGRIWATFPTGMDVSSDGGASWAPVAGFTLADEVDAVNGRVAVIGRRTGDTETKIYYSATNGSTWDEITRDGQRFPSALAVAVDPWVPGRVWISTSGRSVSRFTAFSPIEYWRQQNFGIPDNAGVGRDEGDFDLDGRQNLLEYALGLDPKGADAPALGRVTLAPASSVNLPRLARRSDVTLTLELATDLAGPWTAQPAAPVQADTETLLRVGIPPAWAAQPSLFARFRISR